MSNASSSAQPAPILRAVTICTGGPGKAAIAFNVLLGKPSTADEDKVYCADGTRLIVTSEGSVSGLARVTFAVPAPKGHAEALLEHGFAIAGDVNSPVISRPSACGVEVAFESLEERNCRDGSGGARLDHVALVVADLKEATHRWAQLLDQTADEVGQHPLGNSDTARFLLGGQMIELVSPWQGADTPMRRRLEISGDGPIALALVPADLTAAIGRLEAAGVRLVRQGPHVFVHPGDTGGVLVQLTPRLEH